MARLEHPLGVWVMNRQRARKINPRKIETLVRIVLERMACTAELGIHFVSPHIMAKTNWNYLRHPGSTDVITFDHGSTKHHLHGELFISVEDAVAQSTVYGATWGEEINRYIVHGLLHLQGYDDIDPAKRRIMKRRENALMKACHG